MAGREVELNDLIVTLEGAGVPILTGDGMGRVLDLASLVEAVVEGQWPARVRSALIPLFLARPELANRVRALVSRLSESAAFKLKVYYTAAVYLECRWKTRLEYSLGPSERLPDLFSRELGLSPPEAYHGILGLQELAERAARELGGFDFLAEFENAALVFMEVRERQLSRETDPARGPA